MDLNVSEIVESIKGRPFGIDFDVEVKGISTDTRTMLPGEVFFALKGEHHDGHDFVKEAIAKGAVFCVVERKITGENEVLVEDTLKSLGDLAHYYRRKKDPRVIGITGTVGKTTTKEFTYNIMKKSFKTLKTEKNYNNLIGLPLTILSMEDEDHLVVELGSNRKGEIRRLSEISNPDIGVITEVTPVHTEFLENVEGVFKEKASICGYVNETMVVNGDNAYLTRIEFPHVVKVGMAIDNDHVVEILEEGVDGSVFRIDGTEFRINVPGRGAVIDAAISVVVGFIEGVPPLKIKEALEETIDVHHRMELVDACGVTIIDDSYNASPASMRNAIDYLSLKEGLRVAVLGEMLELGKLSAQLHLETGKYLKGKVDHLLAIGREALYYLAGYGGGFYAEEIDEAVRVLLQWIKPGSWILVKGSRKNNLDLLVKKLKEKLCSTTFTT